MSWEWQARRKPAKALKPKNLQNAASTRWQFGPEWWVKLLSVIRAASAHSSKSDDTLHLER